MVYPGRMSMHIGNNLIMYLPRLLESCNSGSTPELPELRSWMEHWLQHMCCALAVVLVPYFGDVGGRSRKRRRGVILVDIQAKVHSGVSTSLYTEVKAD